MPSLGASTSSTGRHGKGRNVRRRGRIIASLFTQNFNDGDVSDWTAGTGAVVSNGLSNNVLMVATGSGTTNAYAYREITCEPNVGLDFSIGAIINIGTEGKVWIGTSAGDDTYVSEDVTSSQTVTGSFTPTGSSYFISLATTSSRNNMKWDNLTITEA
tara:strand:+ start:2188 stop:2661 length:474 start_codon:yes stop_codon:yes gene_type:complete